MDHDVLVIGGSFSGLAAAMQLARARRRVCVLDTGAPRNRFAAASHGFPGQDGRPPQDIRAALRHELAVYPTLSLRDGAAVSAAREGNGFRVAWQRAETSPRGGWSWPSVCATACPICQVCPNAGEPQCSIAPIATAMS